MAVSKQWRSASRKVLDIPSGARDENGISLRHSELGRTYWERYTKYVDSPNNSKNVQILGKKNGGIS